MPASKVDGATTAVGAPAVGQDVFALDLNAAGQVVGYAGYSLGGGASQNSGRAFVWNGTALSLLSGFDHENVAVGSIWDGFEAGTAVVWRDGGVSDLNDLIGVPLPNRLTRAVAINDLGQIVAWAERDDFGVRSYLPTPAGVRVP